MNLSSDALPSAAIFGRGEASEDSEQVEEDERQPNVDGLASPASPGTVLTAHKQGGTSMWFG